VSRAENLEQVWQAAPPTAVSGLLMLG